MDDEILHFDGSADDLVALIDSKSNLVVVDFFATWCGPCQRMSQALPKIAKENPDVTFIKVDIDKNKGAASRFSIKSVPHLIFYKNKKELDFINGADINGVKVYVAKYKNEN